VENTKVSIGENYTYDGTKYVGFKVEITDGFPTPKTDYAREKVIEILKPAGYKITQLSNTHLIINT
jgi:hypothetical protein